MVREVIRTGEDSREEATELDMDAGAETVGELGSSLGTWDMAGFDDLTVDCNMSATSASLVGRCAVFESACLALLD